MSCLFCKIAAGEIPATLVHEDDAVVAFRDIAPKAPVHVLVVPRRHVTSLADADDADAEVLGRVLLAARDVARAEGVDATGYRLIVNTRGDGGQEVPHLHVHVLGGRQLGPMLAR